MVKTTKPVVPASYSLQNVTEKHINMIYGKTRVSVTAKETAMILKLASHGKPGNEEKALPSRAVLCSDRSDLRVVDSLIKMKGVLRNTKTDTDRVGFTEGIGEAVCKMVLKAKSLGTLPALPATSGTGPVKTTPPAQKPAAKTSGPSPAALAAVSTGMTKRRIVIKKKSTGSQASVDSSEEVSQDQETETTENTTEKEVDSNEKQSSDSKGRKPSADAVSAEISENGFQAKNDLSATRTEFEVTTKQNGRGEIILGFPDFPLGAIEALLTVKQQQALLLVATGEKGQFEPKGCLWVSEIKDKNYFTYNGLCTLTLAYVGEYEGKLFYRLSELGRRAAETIQRMTGGKFAVSETKNPEKRANVLKTVNISEPESVSTVKGIGPEAAASSAPAQPEEPKKKGGMVVKTETETEVITILSESGGSVSKLLVPGRLNFAVIKLVKEGFLTRNEGILSLTDTGKERAGMTTEADPFSEGTSDTPTDQDGESEIIDPLAEEMNAVEASTATTLTIGKKGQTELPLDQDAGTVKKKIVIKKK